MSVTWDEVADLSWGAGRPPYPIHRLDMHTSGVVIVAKQASVVQRLHELFRCHPTLRLRSTTKVPASSWHLVMQCWFTACSDVTRTLNAWLGRYRWPGRRFSIEAMYRHRTVQCLLLGDMRLHYVLHNDLCMSQVVSDLLPTSCWLEANSSARFKQLMICQCCCRERDVKKVYCALSVGKLPAGTIQVDGPIGQSPHEK